MNFTNEELVVIYQVFDQVPLRGSANKALVASIQKKIEAIQPAPVETKEEKEDKK